MGAVAVLLLAGVGFLVGRDETSSNGDRADSDVVEVASDTRHRYAELGELVAATDLVVSGRVVAVEPGRTFGAVDDEGNAGGNAIRSNVVTVEVRDVIAAGSAVAPPAAGTVVLVEEEATLLDGTPIAVDGARATKVGDAGIWFLSASTDPEFPGFTVVNSQGRYLLADADGRQRVHRCDPGWRPHRRARPAVGGPRVRRPRGGDPCGRGSPRRELNRRPAVPAGRLRAVRRRRPRDRAGATRARRSARSST